ncbi:MAG: aspartate-semialdehyde dehydrogenase [Christensenellaceae bacterium]|nr:aspartate-semialdehyde dehydrogenase [Christensenellaceae bacterium]
MRDKLNVGIIGATGMVGQRFIMLLHNHPWFNISLLAASARSAGKPYGEVVENRWAFETPIPSNVKDMIIVDAQNIDEIEKNVDFIFCAVDMKKDEIKALEEAYAKAEIPVVSNNSANRLVDDIPMLIPEVNYEHAKIIEQQKKRLGTKRGFIAVKPNCSIQSYVPALFPLMEYEPYLVSVCTYQAISGAGKTFETWPEMVDNVIPYIGGEDEKSEIEPLKIFGKIVEENGTEKIKSCEDIKFSAQCVRVASADGHLAAVSVKFRKKPTKEAILKAWKGLESKAVQLGLPSAPDPFLTYFEEDNRPQVRLDRDLHNGMGISMGRLREDNIFDYKFICLSHNTLRGAAGGGVLMAEYLVKEGYITKK